MTPDKAHPHPAPEQNLCPLLQGGACLFHSSQNNHWKIFCENVIRGKNCPLQKAAEISTEQARKEEREKVIADIKRWMDENTQRVAEWNDGCPFVWTYYLREKLLKSLQNEAGGSDERQPAQERIDAVIKELERRVIMHREKAKRLELPEHSYRASSLEEAIALLQEGRK